MEAFVVVLAARGCHMLVGGCLQRTAAAGAAWRLSFRCGTSLEDGACGIDNMGRLGLQLTAAGCSTSLELLRCRTSSEDGASDIFGFLARRWRSFTRVMQRDEVGVKRRLDCLMGTLGGGATLSTILMATQETDL